MRILHVFRAPVGGLFRHVCDLVRAQAGHGHEVGMICDSSEGGASADQRLTEIADVCSLGVLRMPIARPPGRGDLSAIAQVTQRAATLRPDIIHCHGAKGGLYGRVAGWRLKIPAVYTPHGGSLYYRWTQPIGALALFAERVLVRFGSGFIFVCAYEQDMFRRKVGTGSRPSVISYNGLWPEEFVTVETDADAADLLFVGEMRWLKGVDVLIAAIARIAATRPIRALLVGDGPDLDTFRRQAAAAGLADRISFPGRLPAREVFRRGRIVVVPSRAESFPYLVIEAMAAGKPMIASRVGGIPEVLGPDCLFTPDNVDALAEKIISSLAQGEALGASARRLRAALADRFAVEKMVGGVLDFYASLIRR